MRDIFGFVASVYLKLTWHESSDSYYAKAAGGGEEDIEPSEILLAVVNDAKAFRNRVEDFLSVPRNTFENERPTERRLQSVTANAEQEFSTLKASPLNIKQMMLESICGPNQRYVRLLHRSAPGASFPCLTSTGQDK